VSDRFRPEPCRLEKGVELPGIVEGSFVGERAVDDGPYELKFDQFRELAPGQRRVHGLRPVELLSGHRLADARQFPLARQVGFIDF
jgi:hypothetical protein